jgi:hypothetical protein
VSTLTLYCWHCTRCVHRLRACALAPCLCQAVGITHIVNCSAITTENFFPESFEYKALYINDAPGEDLSCHIYSVVSFIDEVCEPEPQTPNPLLHYTLSMRVCCIVPYINKRNPQRVWGTWGTPKPLLVSNPNPQPFCCICMRGHGWWHFCDVCT